MKIVTNEKKLKLISVKIERDDFPKHQRMLQSVVDDYSGKLQGCSCIQYGQPFRGFVMRHPKTKEFSFVFNPIVIWQFGKRTSFEGCLSVKGRYYVIRPLFVKAEWEDENGNKITKILGPKRSRIFMHEMDHLNGTTIKMKGFGGIEC